MKKYINKLICAIYHGTSKKRRLQTSIILKYNSEKKLYDKLSKNTIQFLKIRNLYDTYKRSPSEVLCLLTERLYTDLKRDLLLVLAELCYHEAEKKSEDLGKLYLSSAYYAYSFLFDTTLADINHFSPNFILARSLYNYSLAKLVNHASGRKIKFELPASLQILGGRVNISALLNELPWEPDNYDQIFVAYNFDTKGFLAESKEDGIGVPLVAARNVPVKNVCDSPKEEQYLLPNEQVYAITGVLRFKNTVSDMIDNNMTCDAAIELYNPYKTYQICINNSQVPLEIDITSTIAYFLNGKPQTQKLRRLLEPGEHSADVYQGIYMISPFSHEKIPIVFVHGLLSSARTWEQTINLLAQNPLIRKRYQIWLFSYPTGNPILYSAYFLRSDLKEIANTYDPELKNQNFNKMVIIGHSMGGLLAKMMILKVNEELIKLYTDIPLEELHLPGKTLAFTKQLCTFDPLPFVSRCIFLSVPHRGSQLATRLAGFTSHFIELPDILTRHYKKFIRRVLVKSSLNDNVYLRTGVNSLEPDNPTLVILDKLRPPPGTVCNSIIGNINEDNIPGGSDSVVPYSSSHLDYAESELIIKCNHATPSNPKAIFEIERILLEHLDRVDGRR